MRTSCQKAELGHNENYFGNLGLRRIKERERKKNCLKNHFLTIGWIYEIVRRFLRSVKKISVYNSNHSCVDEYLWNLDRARAGGLRFLSQQHLVRVWQRDAAAWRTGT